MVRRKGQGWAKNPERTDVRDETSDECERHHLNKEARLKEETTSQEREDTRQDLREYHRAGDLEANSRIFRQDSKNEELDLMEGSAASETEETARRVGAGNIGAPVTLGSFPVPVGKTG
jgi:hypothetical protein